MALYWAMRFLARATVLAVAMASIARPASAQTTTLTGAAVLVERHGQIWNQPAGSRPRVGVITNRSAVMPDGTPDIDALARLPDLDVVEILSPEHGFRVDSQSKVGDSTDSITGLPVYSLYGKTLAPTPEMLAHVDALVFDIQDVGVRFYTYISTMYLAMEAAARAHKKFVVLDRPDPIGGTILEGPMLRNRFRSFTGIFPLPVRHGMTVGELARLFNTRIGCDLTVVPMIGWQRDMWWDQTGLPWVDPSPAMVCLTAAELYPGMCFFEATNVDPRLGPKPFEQFGAPWIDGDRLARQLDRFHLPGVRFEGVPVTPGESRSWDDWHVATRSQPAIPARDEGSRSARKAVVSDAMAGGSRVPAHQAVRVIVTDRDAIRPVRVAMCALSLIHKDYGTLLAIDPRGFDRLAGTSTVLSDLLSGKDPLAIASSWQSQDRSFARRRQPFLLYP